jgi:hypothetical protein
MKSHEQRRPFVRLMQHEQENARTFGSSGQDGSARWLTQKCYGPKVPVEFWQLNIVAVAQRQ